jgi:Zn-dependent peptidase ImmA (M78 family)
MSQSIEAAICELYQLAEVPQQTEKRYITPLNDLVGIFNLRCIEIAGLTSEEASCYLLRQGVIAEPLSACNREPLAGYIYVGRSVGHIFVEKNDLLVRRRFSVAHELGHYVLHFLPLIEQLEQDGEVIEIIEALNKADEGAEEPPMGKVYLPFRTDLEALLPPYERMEYEANRFAATLLMPDETVKRRVHVYAADCRGEDLIWRLATELLVSKEAMKWRLHNLDLLPAQITQ